MKEIIILHLVLKCKWYDMIDAGIKKEEYRAMNPYWKKRLAEHYTHICFHRAYTATRLYVELNGITEGYGKPEWGAKNEVTYILHLGKKVLSTRQPINPLPLT